MVLPCWILAGTPFPNALGTRVTLPPLDDPAAWWEGVRRVATDGRYLSNPWVAGCALLLAGMVALARQPQGRLLAWMALLILLNLLLRSFLGLTHFSVHDRYVSYLWPLYSVMVVYGIHGAWCVLARSFPVSEPAKRLLASSTLVIGVVGSLAAPLLGYPELRRDVEEMNQMVVEPSRWMAAHLPPDSRIAMEPAGAIRLLTPFYLVDMVGLTTRHIPAYRASTSPFRWEDFLDRHGVTHVFDYAGRVPMLRNGERFQLLKVWRPEPRRFSQGALGLFRVRLSRSGNGASP
jgi:hypothetical protein